MTPTPGTNLIDAYIAEFPPDVAGVLEQMRALIREQAPEAEELISYSIPTFDIGGHHVVHFAGFKQHIGFYPTGKGMDEFAAEFAGYKTGRGSVQFPLGTPLPAELISRVVAHRVAQTRALKPKRPKHA